MFSAWWGLTGTILQMKHSNVTETEVPPKHTIPHPCIERTHAKGMEGVPLIITAEPMDTATFCVYGTCCGDEEWLRGPASQQVTSYDSFQWCGNLEIEGQALRTMFYGPGPKPGPCVLDKTEGL
jgi:hypothetical protein